MRISNCRSCDARIVWATTSKQKLMPVDAEPSDKGNVELVSKPGTKAVLAVVHAQPPFDAPELHMPHHATCPKADQWKR